MNKEFKIDKEFGDVIYNDKLHLYIDKNDNVKYISVTTLIGKFEQFFDEDFWSKYKVIEKLVTPDIFKARKGGLLNNKKIDDKILLSFNLDLNLVKDEVNKLLAEWKETNRIACERGTEIHAKFENLFYKRDFNIINKFDITNDYICKQNNYDILKYDKGIFPELLMYYKTSNGILRIAGQADIIIKDGNDIWVLDFKTNKKLDQKSYFDTKTKKNKVMLYPLNNLMDCNMIHYQLQLSTYAWILQKMNPDFNIKLLEIIHFDHDGNENRYDLEYIPNDVERMLKFYGKQLEHEKFLKENERLKF